MAPRLLPRFCINRSNSGTPLYPPSSRGFVFRVNHAKSNIGIPTLGAEGSAHGVIDETGISKMAAQSDVEKKRHSTISRRKLLGAGAASALLSTRLLSASTADGAGIQDVIIIGAGISGMTSAKDLMQAGNQHFLVLEARDRVGGRTLNHNLAGGKFSEAGGQWIGGTQDAIYRLADDMGIGTFPTLRAGRSVYLSGDGRMEEDMGGEFGVSPTMRPVVDELDALARSVPSGAPWTAPNAAELDRLNYYDWTAAKGVDPLDLFSLESGATLTNGTHPRKVSLLHFLSMLNYAGGWDNLEGFEVGAQKDRIQGGSQWISQKIAQSVGDRLKLACPVRKISGWDTDITTLHTDRGTFRTRKLIIALSPALCRNISFEPALPADRTELQRRWPAHGPGRKTAHVYETPFWREKGLNGWIFEIGGELMWAYDNSPMDGSIGVLNAFIHPSLPSAPEVIGPMLTKMFARAIGDEALSPLEFHDYDWAADPWSPGCVSPLPPGFLTSGLMPSLRDPLGSIIWSGTETAEVWHGYMDGGVRAGHRSAAVALESLGRG